MDMVQEYTLRRVYLELKNALVVDNEASWNGGGIYITLNSHLNSSSSIITRNKANEARGGGLYAKRN